MEDITVSDYNFAKRVCNDFEIFWVSIMICILKVIHYHWLMLSKTLEKYV